MVKTPDLMYKSLFSALLSLTVCSACFSQDVKIACGTKTIGCENGNKSHFSDVMDYKYTETDTTQLPKNVLAEAARYLKARVGNEFYRKINYYACQLVGERDVPNPKTKGIKYAIQYYFTVQGDMRYYLTLAFNAKGELLSPDRLPNIAQNPALGNIIDVCRVYDIAAKDNAYAGAPEGLSLEYSEAQSAFMWKVRKPGERHEGKLMVRFIYIHANTGEVIKRTEIAQRVIYHPAF